MKLAVRKDPSGSFPGAGFHYMVHPIKMESEFEAQTFEAMGHIVIEVTDEKGEELLKRSHAALSHQIEVAIITEEHLKALRESVVVR